MTDEYTGGTVATMIVVPILLVILALAFLFCFLAWRAAREDHSPDAGPLLAGWLFAAILIVSTVVGTWWGMYPWKAEYHRWRTVSGVVATVDSRLTGTADGSMEDKFVVTFEGDGQQYGLPDTRAAALRKGDHLTINCVRIWQWSGSHGYDCRFVERVAS